MIQRIFGTTNCQPLYKVGTMDAAVIGTVGKIAPNPNKSTLIIQRIYIKDAEIVLESDITSKISTSANK